MAQSAFLPDSISSRKIRVNSGDISVTKAAIRAKVNVSQKASPAPLRFFLIYERMLVCSPPFWKCSVGLKVRQMPVKCLRNSSIGHFTGPEPGSFRQALPFLSKPLNTTKCSKFQWMMAGCVPSSASGSMRKPLASRP